MEVLDGKFAAKQSQGARAYQEDDFGFLETSSGAFFVLADGMGGHVGGQHASSVAVKAMIDAFNVADGDISADLQSAAHGANEQVRQAINDDDQLSGMGTTLVGVAAAGNGLYWVSIGDSPLWLLRGGDLYRLNEDHSMAPVLADLVETGRMSAADAAADKRRNSLRSAVMGEDLPLVDTGGPLGLQQGDVIILASDGLETLSPAKIRDVARDNLAHGAAGMAMALIAAVEWAQKPNQDNTTVLIFEVDRDRGGEDLGGRTPVGDGAETSGNDTGLLAKLGARVGAWFRRG